MKDKIIYRKGKRYIISKERVFDLEKLSKLPFHNGTMEWIKKKPKDT